MSPNFSVILQHSTALTEIPGDWTTSNLKDILELTDYGDTAGLSDTEVREMACMSLADMEKSDASEMLLKYVFPNGELNEGQIKNASHEMEDEPLWEEYPVPARHRAFFRAFSLLYAAYNGGFPKPTARRLTVEVKAHARDAALMADPPAAFVARLLAAGMDGHALIHRLYESELTGRHFKAAGNIIWSVKSTMSDENTYELDILSSDYWLDSYQPHDAYEVAAYPDDPEEEAED